MEPQPCPPTLPPLELVEGVAHPQGPQHQQQAEHGPLSGALDEGFWEGVEHLAGRCCRRTTSVSREHFSALSEICQAAVGQRGRVVVLVKD